MPHQESASDKAAKRAQRALDSMAFDLGLEQQNAMACQNLAHYLPVSEKSSINPTVPNMEVTAPNRVQVPHSQASNNMIPGRQQPSAKVTKCDTPIEEPTEHPLGNNRSEVPFNGIRPVQRVAPRLGPLPREQRERIANVVREAMAATERRIKEPLVGETDVLQRVLPGGEKHYLIVIERRG